jgi:hypothetical protein
LRDFQADGVPVLPGTVTPRSVNIVVAGLRSRKDDLGMTNERDAGFGSMAAIASMSRKTMSPRSA